MTAVFGATGQTGGEATRQLGGGGAPVRALVHSPQKAKALEGLGVEIAQADLEQPQALQAAAVECSSIVSRADSSVYVNIGPTALHQMTRKG